MVKNKFWIENEKNIIACNRCSRLREHCLKIAHDRKKAFSNQKYWGKPVSGFGDYNGAVVIIGLAPAAHGANRTGRMFTGDRSGLWLYRALYKSGFANQAESVAKDDGLTLSDAFITATVRCAPPENKPTPEEVSTCTETFLIPEFQNLRSVKVYLCLGKLAYDKTWSILKKLNKIQSQVKKKEFKHGLQLEINETQTIIASFHPSQQNTFTGKLTEPMFDSVFAAAKTCLKKNPKSHSKSLL